MRPAASNFLLMLRPSPKLEEIDRRHARERLARRSYSEALAVFAALWREASALDGEFPGPWREDLEADLAVARAVNGFPPDA